MSFQCKKCGTDIEPTQAKDTYDEFGNVDDFYMHKPRSAICKVW